jgi:5'-deoxynucleotidase YfbR-like HD superfamily hydrolase
LKLDIFQMLVGVPVRLRYVQRFSTCRVGARETVAEHSFYTAAYSLLIGRWVEARYPGHPGRRVDFGILFQKSILHDFEEAVSGDINRPFKYSTPELEAAMGAAAFAAFQKTWKKVTDSLTVASLSDYWVQAKECGVEGDIVAFADYLSVLSYVTSEIRSSNWTMREHTEGEMGLEAYHKLFETERFDYLRPLVDQAGKILQEQILAKQWGEV